MAKKSKIKSPITVGVTDKVAKSTVVEINQRVSEVQGLLLQGRTRSAIVQYGSKWKISSRQIDDYIAKATELVKEVNALSTQHNLGIITNNLWDVYREARSVGNLAEASKVLMNIAKLRGLDQTTINHVIDDKRDLQELSDHDLDALLEGDDDTIQ